MDNTGKFETKLIYSWPKLIIRKCRPMSTDFVS